MEIHPNIQNLRIQKNICDQAAEQAFVFDYLLADYLPDIFKILKCDVIPSVVNVSVSDGRITIDLNLELRVLYLAEQTKEVSLISQKQSLQKQIEVPAAKEDANVFVTVRSDSTRCRVVNPRRIDVRGAVLLKINAELAEPVNFCARSEKQSALQERLTECSCITGKTSASEELTLSEETPLPYGNPPIETVLLYRCCPVVEECKRSGDKMLCKGHLQLHLLYLAKAQEGEKPQLHTAEISVPADAVLTLSASAQARLQPMMELVGAEFTVDEEKAESISGQYQVRVTVTAIEDQSVEYVDDVYSTVCPVEKQTEDYTVLRLQEMVQQTGVCKNTIALSGGALSHVSDLLCDVKGVSLRQLDNGAVLLAINLNLCLLAEEEGGMPFCVEKSIPCELQLDVPVQSGEPYFVPSVTVQANSYRITEAGELECRTELQITGCLCRKQKVRMVTGITADDGHPYPKDDAALHLYYAKAGEQLWEIAKAFKTDYAAAMSENELTAPVLTEDQMLLIPML